MVFDSTILFIIEHRFALILFFMIDLSIKHVDSFLHVICIYESEIIAIESIVLNVDSCRKNLSVYTLAITYTNLKMVSLPQENRTGMSPRAFSTKYSDLKPVGALKLLSVLAEGKRRARL